MEQIKRLVDKASHDCFGETVDHSVSLPEKQFGDFATNIALVLAKKLARQPKEIAEIIATELHKQSELKKIDVAGPGFINIVATDEFLAEVIAQETPQPLSGMTVVAETNNPNPFKAMHIGHAFNSILADTIANLLEAGGANVHRVSYHGDVGAHVGKSMYSLLNYVDGDSSKLHALPTSERNVFMSKMYASGAKAFNDDTNAKVEIEKLTEQSFILDDPIYAEVYQTVKQWSFDEIDNLVRRLGNQPIEKRYIESEADELGVKTVKSHVGETFIKSNGALVFPGSKYDSFDNAYVTSAGRGLYGARDLGLMQLKHNDYKPHKSYIVTAEEQRDYFRGVMKASELCLPELQGITTNITHGTVKLTTGKMSSRSGDVLEVGWLFDQISQAITDSGNELNDAVITGAIRYQFLKVRVGSDVVFDVNEAASIQGNSGPYIQYAYARAYSILSKANNDSKAKLDNLEPAEHKLLLKISEYNSVITRAINELLPHHIANYLYDLTQSFNSFYEKNRILGHERESARLTIIQHYIDTLYKGLVLLGIPVLKKM